MVDHHTLINGFYDWYREEKTLRGYCPGNWKWIIPPQAAALSPAYLKLNKMIEYCLKPAYLYAPSWTQLETAWFGAADGGKRKSFLTLLYVFSRVIGRLRLAAHRRRLSVLIVYASVSGKTRTFAGRMGKLLQDAHCTVELLDAAQLHKGLINKQHAAIDRANVLVFMTSSYGNGDVPLSAVPLLEHIKGQASQAKPSERGSAHSNLRYPNGVPVKKIQQSRSRGAAIQTTREKGKDACKAMRQSMEIREMLERKYFQKPFAVLGFGSSMYPKFCGGAEQVFGALEGAGGKSLLPLGKCDEQTGEESNFYQWMFLLGESLKKAFSKAQVDLNALRDAAPGGAGLLPVQITELKDMEAREYALDQMLHGHAPSFKNIGGVDESAPSEFTRTRSDSEHPTFGTIRSRINLLPGPQPSLGGGERSTALLTIDLSACPIPHIPGDHLAIIPCNMISEDTLGSFCHDLGVTPDLVFVPSLPADVRAKVPGPPA